MFTRGGGIMADMSFSERMGLTKPKAKQNQGMDDDLRVCLWNVITRYLYEIRKSYKAERANSFHIILCEEIWGRFLKWPLDSIPSDRFGTRISDCWDRFRKWYHDQDCPWNHIYDFIQFVARYQFDEESHDFLVKGINEELEGENIAYRFANGEFIPITREEELQAIQAAASIKDTPLAHISMHIDQAVEHLSNKTNPDYRNSMKESISAVEGICKLIAGTPSAPGLSSPLEKTASLLDIDSTLKDGFKKIYGFTSDKLGIRHPLKDKEHPTQEDARFLLVICSAFVNYIIELARKQGKLPSE